MLKLKLRIPGVTFLIINTANPPKDVDIPATKENNSGRDQLSFFVGPAGGGRGVADDMIAGRSQCTIVLLATLKRTRDRSITERTPMLSLSEKLGNDLKFR